jgi:hypothetical protein
MHHVTNDRLFCSPAALILILVKKDKTTMTSGQLYALELAARRERSLAQARLLKAGAGALKSAIVRALHALKLKGMSHA